MARANSRILYSNDTIPNQQIASIKFAPKFIGTEQNLPHREINLQQTMKNKVTKGAIVQMQKNQVLELKTEEGRQSIGGLMSSNISMLMRDIMNRSVSESDHEDESVASPSLTKLVTPQNEKQIFQTATAQPSSRSHLLKQNVSNVLTNRHRDIKGQE
jgi:hypothetical protein